MSSHRDRRPACAAAALGLFAAVLLLLPCVAHAAPLYRLTPVEMPDPVLGSQPMSINDRGEVSGYLFQNPLGGPRPPDRPFAWRGSGPAHELPVPADTAHSVYGGIAINNRGDVLGHIGNNGVVWSPDGVMRTVPLPAGYTSQEPVDMNDAGMIVSEASHAAERRYSGVRRHADGTVEELSNFYPKALNDRGAVVGWVAFQGPAVWEPEGTIRPLESPGLAAGRDINDAGWITGTVIREDRHSIAVWRPDGTLIVVPVPGLGMDAAGSGLGINNRGEVVGGARLDGGRALYWTEGEGLVDLQTRLDASGAGWDLQAATAINDAGQIVASARAPYGSRHQHTTVLLTPVPEPVLAPGAILGLAALGRRRRRSLSSNLLTRPR